MDTKQLLALAHALAELPADSYPVDLLTALGGLSQDDWETVCALALGLS